MQAAISKSRPRLETAKPDTVNHGGPAADHDPVPMPRLSTPRTLGNQGVINLLQPRSVIGDADGQEADRYGYEIRDMSLQGRPNDKPSPSSIGRPVIQRRCKACRDEEEPAVQRSYWEKRSLDTAHIQPKLKIGAPGDQYEREADRMADRVMGMPREERQIRTFSPAASVIQRQPLDPEQASVYEEEEEEEGEVVVIQRRVQAGRTAPASPLPAGIVSLPGRGRPLPEATRHFFAARMGHDFSDVRVHTGAAAAGAAQSLHARAFTMGRDVVFNKGEYAPDTHSGKRLLAHELTHVIQQSAAGRRQGNNGVARVTASAKTIRRQVDANSCRKTGCTLDECRSVDQDIGRAMGYLNTAIRKMNSNPYPADVKKALRCYFHITTGAYKGTILRNLRQIRELLGLYRNSLNYLKSDPEGCKKHDETLAYVIPPSKTFKGQSLQVRSQGAMVPRHLAQAREGNYSGYSQIYLCGVDYFGAGAPVRARALIHEAAHLLGLPRTKAEDIYVGTGEFIILKSSKLVENADSHAYFATALATGSYPECSPVYVSMGAEMGGVFGLGRGRRIGMYARGYIDVVSKTPLLRVLYPYGRLGFTAIGTKRRSTAGTGTQPAERGLKADWTLLTEFMGGLRIKLRKKPLATNWYVSVGGGLLFVFTENRDENGRVTKYSVGAKGTVAGGLRYRNFEAKVGLSFLYLPKVPGFEYSLQGGATAGILFNWP